MTLFQVGDYTDPIMKTWIPKPEELNKKWYLVDAKGKVLGRLASRIAAIIRGKTKPSYTPHLDTGDFVVVINAAQIKLTGKKFTDKVYYHHTLWPGGLRSTTPEKMMAKFPERVLELAVKRMLPNTPLGRKMFKKVKIYPGPDHPHEAQKPEPLELN